MKNFKKFLKEENIDFIVENNVIVITNNNNVDLRNLTTLPENVVFNNGGSVDLNSLTILPESTVFNNGGGVYLSSLTTLPENVVFNNGGNVYLPSLTVLPESTVFNNGGNVYLHNLAILPKNVVFNNGGCVKLKSEIIDIRKSYVQRFNLEVDRDNCVTLYKRVSQDFKTQEDTSNETLWLIGTTVTHPNWNPDKTECGAGKFHACARPHWCDAFRSEKGDRYISIKVNLGDLHEWRDNPYYSQKIGFRSGTVIAEVQRIINNKLQ